MSKNLIVPAKLKPGDVIRVIAPAQSGAIISQATRSHATHIFQDRLGLQVTFSEHIDECDLLTTSSRTSRLSDFHEAFKDIKVKAILTMIGGFSSNELLPFIDYNLIRANPKIFCGFSDITALCLAIYKKSNVMTYIGPHYSSFGMKEGLDYTIDYFRKTLFDANEINAPLIIKPASHYSSDLWFIPGTVRNFIPNNGSHVIRTGKATGVAMGGNISLLRLLQGTPYFPLPQEPFILFLEDDDLVKDRFAQIFMQQMVSLMQIHEFTRWLKGVVVGRCCPVSTMDVGKFEHIFKEVLEAYGVDVPVVINMSFGHTTPIFTIPIGGKTELKVQSSGQVELSFLYY